MFPKGGGKTVKNLYTNHKEVYTTAEECVNYTQGIAIVKYQFGST